MRGIAPIPFSTSLTAIHTEIANAPQLAPVDPPPARTLREKFVRWFQREPDPQARQRQLVQRAAFIAEFDAYLSDRWGFSARDALNRVPSHNSLRPVVSDILRGIEQERSGQANATLRDRFTAEQVRELDGLPTQERRNRIHEIRADQVRQDVAGLLARVVGPHAELAAFIRGALQVDIPADVALDAVIRNRVEIDLRPEPVAPARP